MLTDDDAVKTWIGCANQAIRTGPPVQKKDLSKYGETDIII